LKKKLFFLHIPKTAGTFFNDFLAAQFNEYIDHIESKYNLEKKEDVNKLSNLKAFSGHIIYPLFKRTFNIKNFTTITVLRNPIEQVVSHITYVRELGEESEKERLNKHNDTVKSIVKKLKKTDLSNPTDIEKFIHWLEKKNIWLFHDCQTRYLGGGGKIQPANLNNALKNLDDINYVGITERLKEFMILLNLTENFKLIEYEKKNVTKNRYGLDINNIEIRKVLQPLIQNDHIVYRYAREKFINNLHTEMIKMELRKGPRYSSVRVELIYNELRREDV